MSKLTLVEANKSTLVFGVKNGDIYAITPSGWGLSVYMKLYEQGKWQGKVINDDWQWGHPEHRYPDGEIFGRFEDAVEASGYGIDHQYDLMIVRQ